MSTSQKSAARLLALLLPTVIIGISGDFDSAAMETTSHSAFEGLRINNLER
jgi:hypothetical protein